MEMTETETKEPELRLFFVPYKASAPPTSGKRVKLKKLTRQQHISREYHRKQKIQRANARLHAPPDTDTAEVDEQNGNSSSSPSSNTSSTILNPYDSSTTPPETPYSPLSAARYDPFDVYCKQQLPMFVHRILDHHLTHVCQFFSLSTALESINATRNYIMSHAMNDPLSWYTVIFASLTHYAYVQREPLPQQAQLLRLSYKTWAMSEIRADIQRNPERASERAIFGISTLAAHGLGEDFKDMRYDMIQERKALGKVNEIHYYSSIVTDPDHWSTVVQLALERGGPGGLTCPTGVEGYPPSPGPGCLYVMDTLNAWRNLRAPIFQMPVSTEETLALRTHARDETAVTLSNKLLGAFDTLNFQSKPMQELMEVLKHTRELLVDFDQYNRNAESLPAVRHLYWVRMMVLCDLLRLPNYSVDAGKTNTDVLHYEICRISCLVFYQLVLYPIMSMNKMPEKILSQLFPILDVCTHPVNGRIFIHDQPWVYLWAVMLGGMLAFEHYQTVSDPNLMDKVAAYFEYAPMKLDRHAWPAVRRAMNAFIWMNSECDGPGQQVWKYVCMYKTTRDENCGWI